MTEQQKPFRPTNWNCDIRREPTIDEEVYEVTVWNDEGDAVLSRYNVSWEEVEELQRDYPGPSNTVTWWRRT